MGIAITSPNTMARAASSMVTGMDFFKDTEIASPVKTERPGLKVTICHTQCRYCSWYGRSSRKSLRSFCSSRGLTFPDSAIKAVSASPGMTRINPNTTSDDSSSTGTTSNRRCSTYLCIPDGSPLLIDPETRQGRSPVPHVAAQVQLTDVAQVRLPCLEAIVTGHPHAQHLIVLPGHNFPGQSALLGAICGLPQLST